jgi:hypothetical protein
VRINIANRGWIAALVVAHAAVTSSGSITTTFALDDVVVVAARVASNGVIAAAANMLEWRARHRDAFVGFTTQRPVDIAKRKRRIVAETICARLRVLLRPAACQHENNNNNNANPRSHDIHHRSPLTPLSTASYSRFRTISQMQKAGFRRPFTSMSDLDY